MDDRRGVASRYILEEVIPDMKRKVRDTSLTVQVDEDFGDETFDNEDDEVRVSKANEVSIQINADASGVDLGEAEDAYKRREIIKEAAPVLIAQAEKMREVQEERIKVEVHEVLSRDVDKRLDKFEKRRRRAKRREYFGRLVKWGIIAAIVLAVYATPALRCRVVLIYQDAVQMVQDAMRGREVSSNKLLQDLFQPISSDRKEEGVRNE